MKATKLFFAASVVIATAALSCQKAEPINDSLITKTYTASVEPTKTAISFNDKVGTVTWETGDRLQFQYDGADKAGKNITTSTTGATGTFTLTYGDDVKNIYAIRMGDPKMGRIGWYSSSAGKVNISLPQEWSAEDWTFNNVNCIAGTAAVSATSLSLSPVLSLIKLTVSNTAIDKFVVTSSNEKAFGSKYVYTFATKVFEEKQGEITNYKNETFHTGGKAGTYYIPVIPGITGTFTIEAFNASGESLGKATTPSITTAPGYVATIGAIESHLVVPQGDPAAEFKTSATEMISAFGYTKKVEFTAAGAWTASIKESGVATIAVASGSAGDASIDVSFAQNTTTSRRTITVVIASEGFDNATLAFTQERKADYEIIFRKYPDIYGKNSNYYNFGGNFVEKVETGINNEYTLKADSNIKLYFGDNSTSGNFGFNEVGFLIGTSGSGKGGYVIFPAVSGKKLVKVEAFTGHSSTSQGSKLSIKTADGSSRLTDEISPKPNTVSQAKTEIPSIQYELTNSFDSYVCFDVKASTAVNTAYRLNFNSRVQIRWFTFYYE
ncbi:MAG: hypothetical protein MJY62_00695 [Bacteroidales bacterium]|nr:hypothetical protein [Bacteroidales bacterium]